MAGDLYGCKSTGSSLCSTGAVLSDNRFTYGSDYSVKQLQENGDDQLFFGLNTAIPDGLISSYTLRVGSIRLRLSEASITQGIAQNSLAIWTGGNAASVDWSGGGSVSVSLVPNQVAGSAAQAGAADPTQRSWPLTAIEDDDPTEWWFPVGRGTCDMKDEDRPWTWKRWKAPTADKCGWLSVPDVRADLDDDVQKSAFKVYTALLPSPDIGGRASVNRPSGASVKMAVWAVYPRTYDGRTVNATRRLKGPYEDPITVCLPGKEGQAIHGYDEANAKWLTLESVESEREGHICGLHKHDLGLLVVAAPSP